MDVSERWVKNEVKKLLKKLGIYYFMPAMNGFGRAGVPDFVACVAGRFLGIECKAGKNKPTELQKNEHEAIRKSLGVCIVVNETNLDVLEQLLQTMLQLGEADGKGAAS